MRTIGSLIKLNFVSFFRSAAIQNYLASAKIKQLKTLKSLNGADQTKTLYQFNNNIVLRSNLLFLCLTLISWNVLERIKEMESVIAGLRLCQNKKKLFIFFIKILNYVTK